MFPVVDFLLHFAKNFYTTFHGCLCSGSFLRVEGPSGLSVQTGVGLSEAHEFAIPVPQPSGGVSLKVFSSECYNTHHKEQGMHTDLLVQVKTLQSVKV